MIPQSMDGPSACIPAGACHRIAVDPSAAYSPELNPVENIQEVLQQKDLRNRVFATYEAIVDACCIAWNRLIAAPESIRSIAMREWTKTVSS
jgi:hypothetical protein